MGWDEKIAGAQEGYWQNPGEFPNETMTNRYCFALCYKSVKNTVIPAEGNLVWRKPGEWGNHLDEVDVAVI